MKIESIRWKNISCELKKPFITSLRTLRLLEVIQVEVVTDTGLKGIGGCAPTAAITGETEASLKGALEHISKLITGEDCSALEPLLHTIGKSMAGNTSAKSALDIALHDLFTKSCGLPLYRYLGGRGECIRTDLTISLNPPAVMASDALEYYNEGFREFKLKVGKDPMEDIERILAVRKILGPEAVIRIDANQGWNARDAVKVINESQNAGAGLDFAEQPVAAADFKGMRYVRENIDIPLVADESVFSLNDAFRLIEAEAADGINIKLAKCGGIAEAVKIAHLAEAAGLFCMTGCMMESHAGVSAAAHFASAVRNVKYADLDVPLLCRTKTEEGGVEYRGADIYFSQKPGIGLKI